MKLGGNLKLGLNLSGVKKEDESPSKPKFSLNMAGITASGPGPESDRGERQPLENPNQVSELPVVAKPRQFIGNITKRGAQKDSAPSPPMKLMIKKEQEMEIFMTDITDHPDHGNMEMKNEKTAEQEKT